MGKTLSVFVDESGNFGVPDSVSRFYIIGLVLHDQDCDICGAVSDLDLALRDLGLSHHYFHAGPMIRREKGYEFMDWNLRRRIFFLMMAFARKVDYRHFCLSVDKRYVGTRVQLIGKLETELAAFVEKRRDVFDAFERIKVYYDCGQPEVTRILHDTIARRLRGNVEFAQGVDPRHYKLFQIADLVCTVKLIEQKLAAGIAMTESEQRFFGGPRMFKRETLRRIKAKELA